MIHSLTLQKKMLACIYFYDASEHKAYCFKC